MTAGTIEKPTKSLQSLTLPMTEDRLKTWLVSRPVVIPTWFMVPMAPRRAEEAQSEVCISRKERWKG